MVFNPDYYKSKVGSKEYFKDLVKHETIDNAVFTHDKEDLGTAFDSINQKSKIPSVII